MAATWTAHLSWSTSPGASSYKIMRKTQPSGTYSLRATVPASQLTYDDAGLALSTGFCYQIVATNGLDATPSPEVCLMAIPPTTVDALNVTFEIFP